MHRTPNRLLAVLVLLLGLGCAVGCNAKKEQGGDKQSDDDASEDPLESARTALDDHEWTQAIQLAELVLASDPDSQGAVDIIETARNERDNLARYKQARALFEARQYDKAYIKLEHLSPDSVYAVRGHNMALRIRQAVVLPETIRRPHDAPMERVLIGAFNRGSTKKESTRSHEMCEKYAGECQMKWFTREQPRRWITLGSFYIDRFEVSVAQYEQCVADGACAAVDWKDCGLGDPKDHRPFAADNLPQVCVTWQEASTYCKSVGTRLPTEAEWEKAAGGPGAERFPWGADWKPHAANHSDGGETDGYEFLAPVDTFDGNDWGLYQMAGNAYEWTGDVYDEKYYADSPDRNPRGPKEGNNRVIRGGAFTRVPSDLRVAARNQMYPETRDKSVGFRCAVEAGRVPPDVEAMAAQAPEPPVEPETPTPKE